MKIAKLLQGPTAALGLIALAACQQAPKDGATANATQAAAEGAGNPDAKPGLAVTGGVLVLPPVKGRPGAAYFTLTNGGAVAATLAAVHVEGANKAEMHETRDGTMSAIATLDLKPGESVTFARGGKHVMAFGLADTLAVGGTAELTLTFSDGDKLSTPLKIESVASTGNSDAMTGMKH